MQYIQRKSYLNKLISLLGTPDIKVITGVRRSGKSVLLHQFLESIEATEPTANIIFVNLQELEYSELLDYKKLHEFVLSRCKEGYHNLLAVDEIQLCDHFELAVNSLHAKGLFDIYLTGSNAFLLSSDLATLFTGRVMEVKVMPFSFREYMDYFRSGLSSYDAFDDFVREGGMAGSYPYRLEEERYAYLKDVYQTVLLRDLVRKYKIRNQAEFSSIAQYMMDNIGNSLSPNNVCKALNKAESDITRKTVEKYIRYLQNAFLFYESKRYDLKGKRYMETNNKYYLCDPTFRYAVNGTKELDFGRVYENIVYIELLRRGYEVYVGKLYQKEIDFVAVKRDEKFYIQVSDDIGEAKTMEREIAPLLQIRDAYPKMILARTRHETVQKDGVLIFDLSTWLLSD